MWLILLNTLLPPIGAILWFWGGCGEDCHPGLPPFNKSWRRHIWPAIVGLVLLLNGYDWLTSALVTGSMVFVNSLGYGHSKPWWYRVLVALALGAPFLFLLPALWPLLTLVAFIPLYVLSLRRNWMTWGVVEATVGATQGAIVLTNIVTLAIARILLGV